MVVDRVVKVVFCDDEELLELVTKELLDVGCQLCQSSTLTVMTSVTVTVLAGAHGADVVVGWAVVVGCQLCHPQ